jgi:hypothetical protein
MTKKSKTKKVNAQTWLDQNYPKKQRGEVKSLKINEKNLVGNLKIEGFVNMISLSCSNNQLVELSVINCPSVNSVSCCANKLTSLKIVSCSQVSEVRCSNNCLSSVDLSGLDTKKIKSIDLRGNNLSQHTLSSLDSFVRLGVCVLDKNRPQLFQQPKPDSLEEKVRRSEKERERMNKTMLLREKEMEDLKREKNLALTRNILLNEEKTSLQKNLQEFNFLKKKLRKVNDELANVRKEVKILRKENAELKIKPKEAEIENLITGFKSKVSEDNQENLETLLETLDEILVKDNSKFIQKHFQRAKSNLSEELTETEIQSLLERRKELFELKKTLSQNQELEIEIEAPTLNISLQQLVSDYSDK